MAETAAKKTAAAAKKTTTASKTTQTKPEESPKVSPIKRSTRTVLALEVDGTQYEGDVEVSAEQLEELDKVAADWDEAQKAYADLTLKLVEMLEELGIEPKVEAKAKPTSDAKKIRRWAARTNVEVNSQGMIPQAIRDQYAAAKAKGELNDDEI
ncbi:histone-like nucleoid-structuring protein Lsr2 [Streptomyces sp. NBC_00197]|uniref:Lsr2 family DNA-binding protein n=1 Tax=Streptomyces sp. NBC_00197 TaxID=2975676 RepID=UPI0032568B1E